MNYPKVLIELLFVFWSYGWIAITYHQARKSGQASYKRSLWEINNRAQLGRFYWQLEPIRAYARGLFRAFSVVAFFLILTAPLVWRSGFYKERGVAVGLAFVITALCGVAVGRSEPYE